MFGNTVKAPSSYYAGVARNLERFVDGYLPTADRFLFRVASSEFPAEVSISTSGEDYIFEPDGSRSIRWTPAQKSILSVVTTSGDANEPVQLIIQGRDDKGRTETHSVTVNRATWQTWQQMDSSGIEYMWVGGATFHIDGLRVMGLSGDKPVLGPVYSHLPAR
jgi:hypothetical protein